MFDSGCDPSTLQLLRKNYTEANRSDSFGIQVPVTKRASALFGIAKISGVDDGTIQWSV